MKYIVWILLGAVIIGIGLTLGIHLLLGADSAYFFAKFIAGPAGLFGAVVCFVVYDTLFPKK